MDMGNEFLRIDRFARMICYTYQEGKSPPPPPIFFPRRKYCSTRVTAERRRASEGLLAPKVLRILRVAASRILRMLRISAQRPAPPRKCLAGGDHRIRRNALFHPVHHRVQHVELVERRTTPAMSHARHEKHPAPFRHLLRAAVGLRQRLVVAKRVERGKPWIAISMKEKYLPATP